jgi:hypothetical protein
MASYPRWDIGAVPLKCVSCKLPISPGADLFIKSKGVYYCADCGLVAEQGVNQVQPGGIEESFLKDLDEFPDDAAATTLAVATRYMARQLDNGEVAPREVTAYIKEVRLNLMQLRELFPPDEDSDDTEERRTRLQERRRREQGGM